MNLPFETKHSLIRGADLHVVLYAGPTWAKLELNLEGSDTIFME